MSGGGGVIKVDVVMRKMFCAGGLLTALLAVSGCAAGGAKVEGKIGVVDPARVLNETNHGQEGQGFLERLLQESPGPDRDG